jgi:RNA polymerase sigma-70 factor (ECF subfamily)
MESLLDSMTEVAHPIGYARAYLEREERGAERDGRGTKRTGSASRRSRQAALHMSQAAARNELLSGLLARAAGGDERAFARLYEATSAQLFGIALRIMRERHAAEDVLQDAYVRIWDSASSYAPDKGAALGWMVAILRHRAIDALRRRRPHLPLDAAPEADAMADANPDPFSHAAQGAATRRLIACLDALGGRQKECLVLAYYDGLTQEELAARLAAPLGTVKSWVRRGLLQLKECLER